MEKANTIRNNFPKVSVITVCFNSEKTLEQTICSVINQTYCNTELIIIDGGSCDNTIDIIEKYKGKITYWVSEPDSGIYNAMNKGIRVARGDYLYFLGSDDTLHDCDVLQKVVQLISLHPSDIIYGNVIAFNKTFGYQMEEGRCLTLEQLQKGWMPPHQGMFIKTEVINKAQGFNEEYRIVSDYDLLMKCLKLGATTSYTDLAIAYFNLEGTSSNEIKMIYERRQVVRKYFSSVVYGRYYLSSAYTIMKVRIKEVVNRINMLKYWYKLKVWCPLSKRRSIP